MSELPSPREAPLSKEERAYRRGALQAIQFLKAELSGVSGRVLLDTLAVWEEALVEGRGSLDVKYMGTYLDEVRTRIRSAACGESPMRRLYPNMAMAKTIEEALTLLANHGEPVTAEEARQALIRTIRES